MCLLGINTFSFSISVAQVVSRGNRLIETKDVNTLPFGPASSKMKVPFGGSTWATHDAGSCVVELCLLPYGGGGWQSGHCRACLCRLRKQMLASSKQKCLSETSREPGKACCYLLLAMLASQSTLSRDCMVKSFFRFARGRWRGKG